MATDLHATTDPAADRAAGVEPGIAATLRGVLDDSLELMKQQFSMLKAEMKSDFRRVLAGVIPIACGIAPILLGGLMLCFMLVHLLHWATSPAGTDPATLPLWGCYGIVALVFFLVGGILLAVGVARLKTLNPLPDETAKALEENVKWLMNPK